MIPVVQTHLTPPTGNCMQACVASLFELPLDDVPNFVVADGYRWNEEMGRWDAAHDLPVPKWWQALGDFAADRGFVALDWPGQRVGHAGLPRDTLAMATIRSPRGPYGHCVVANIARSRVVMDPYPGAEQRRSLEDDELLGWTMFVKIGP